MPVLVKIKKTYDRIFKSAKTKEENDHINLVDALIDRTHEEGVVCSESDSEDLQFQEDIPFYHKGFFVQCFEIGQMHKAYAATDTVMHNLRLESELRRTSRQAIQEVIKHIDKFRESKPNDNKIGRS